MDDTVSNRVKGPIQDLREFLARIEEIGELVRIDAPVERDEEMSAVAYLVAKQKPSPATLFNNVIGFEKSPIGARHLWGPYGPSVRRIAVSSAILRAEDPEAATRRLRSML